MLHAGACLPPGSLLDGEIVIAGTNGESDFDALQRRLGLGRRGGLLAAQERAAVLLCFDLLAIDGVDLTPLPLTARRLQLEQVLAGSNATLQIVTQTSDRVEAEEWLSLVPSVEGVVAKRADRPYIGERSRDWIKVKPQRTVDCVVIGVAGGYDAARLVLALRHLDAVFHHFGVTRTLKHGDFQVVAEAYGEPGPVEKAIPSRWGHAAVPPWRRVPPSTVCEVGYTLVIVGVGCASRQRSFAGDRTVRQTIAASTNCGSADPPLAVHAVRTDHTSTLDPNPQTAAVSRLRTPG